MALYINNTGPYESLHLLQTVAPVLRDDNMEMLKVKNFESCRLCLGEIRDSNITLLDGIIKDMLEIILPELNLSICENPAICKTCLETLKQSYNFKSSCLEVEDKVQDFVNPKSPRSIDLKQVLKKKNNIFQISEHHVVCRTCLGLGDESSCTKLCSYDGDPLKNMVEKCLPEMGIDLTKEPLICPVCLEQLEEQFHFIMQCLDTEEKINYYCERKNTFKQVDLHSVYLFSMMEDNEYVDKQYGMMENGNSERQCTAVTVEDSSKKTDNLIKPQILQENEKHYPDGTTFVDLTNDVFGANIKKDKIKQIDETSKKESNSRLKPLNVQPIELKPPPPATEEVTFKISKDGNGDDVITSQTSLIRNKDSDDDDDDSDVSVTSENALLSTRFVERIRSSGNVGKVKKTAVEYKDDVDVEGSDDSSHGKKRLITRKCKLCNFKTKYTSRMKAHRTVNHSAKADQASQDGESPKKASKIRGESELSSTIKCRSCSYKTTDPDEYKKHKQSHKREKEKKCDICGAVFVRLDFLQKHIENHRPTATSETVIKTPPKNFPRVINIPKRGQRNVYNFNGKFLKMFKCQLCPYQTRMRSNLVRHSMIHKKTSEIVTHKCKLCNFETIQKENFLCHMQTHSHDSENQVKKCFLCSYQPKTEKALKQHVNMAHKSGTG